MSTITIYIKNLAGDVITFRAPAHNGKALRQTVEQAMRKAVLTEMKLDLITYRVQFLQEDEEKKKEPTYEDGAVVTVLVEPFTIAEIWGQFERAL